MIDMRRRNESMKVENDKLAKLFLVLTNRIESLSDNMGETIISLIKCSTFNDITANPSNKFHIDSTGVSIDEPFMFRDSSLCKLESDVVSSDSADKVEKINNKYDVLKSYANLIKDYEKKIIKKRDKRIPSPYSKKNDHGLDRNKMTTSSFFLGGMSKDAARTIRINNKNYRKNYNCFESSNWLSSAVDKNSPFACQYNLNKKIKQVTSTTDERQNVLYGGGNEESSQNRCHGSICGSVILSSRQDINNNLDVSEIPINSANIFTKDYHASNMHNKHHVGGSRSVNFRDNMSESKTCD
jgi:hypothetical protein